MKRLLCIACALVAAGAAGCSSTAKDNSSGYHTLAHDPRRNTELARQENATAIALIREGKYKEAEPRLKKALEADVTFGPAHNNLASVYYRLGQWYLAAWEYQYAAKLMPQQPEPLSNLGLVYEKAGKLEEAIGAYDQAVKLQPEHPEYLANAARARVRRGDRNETLRDLLQRLILVERRPQWAAWAREKLALLGTSPATRPNGP